MGEMTLHIACQKRNKDIIKYLTEKETDINKKNSGG